MSLTYFIDLSIFLTVIKPMQGSEDNYQSNMKYILIMSADPDGDDTIYHDGH